ncbi:MAG: MerC domain-containing protein [Daejeonella sp.]|nr:MerC domain-containing protein [Daejeonella sp.]MDP2412453.1 MerC domain-containing protein [Daejeonella sp.]
MRLINNLDKIGTSGVLLTVLLSPCCFPIIAVAATVLGLGSFELFGEWTMWIFQAMVLISIIGLYISYRRHRCLYPLIAAVISGFLIIYGYHFDTSDYWVHLLYAGLISLLLATIWNYRRNKLHSCCNITSNNQDQLIELRSTITCPNCGHKKDEIMPTDACAYFYECEKCKVRSKPLKGDCCVYCSYGTVKCPPMQGSNPCCTS